MTKTRRLVREGDLGELDEEGDWHLRHFFLFNDILIWATPSLSKSKKRQSTYKYRGRHALVHLTAVNELDIPYSSPMASLWHASSSSSSVILSPSTSLPSSSSSALSSSAPSPPTPNSSLSSSLDDGSKQQGNLYHVLLPFVLYDLLCIGIAYQAPGTAHGIIISTSYQTMVLVARNHNERKAWLKDLYLCMDDAVAKHYVRLGTLSLLLSLSLCLHGLKWNST